MDAGEFGCNKLARLTASEDDLLEFLLVCTWVLTTGRDFPGVPLRDLTEQQLIDFWADD